MEAVVARSGLTVDSFMDLREVPAGERHTAPRCIAATVDPFGHLVAAERTRKEPQTHHLLHEDLQRVFNAPVSSPNVNASPPEESAPC
ncbi:hypothetical protein FQA47_019788 [Oryzias melastigma]|uniref:Uncharacterized protein n=1 Tax=Oryzias melastigma TaxID=30732 RepID=A0A834BYH2_ORYME|nr:hypothetical protein FQA47_019788 [Oryzias melastigma]